MVQIVKSNVPNIVIEMILTSLSIWYFFIASIFNYYNYLI